MHCNSSHSYLSLIAWHSGSSHLIHSRRIFVFHLRESVGINSSEADSQGLTSYQDSPFKIWANCLRGKYFWLDVDNEAVPTVLNTGSSRESELQDSLWEIALIAAQNHFVLKARYIPGIIN